MCKEIDHTEVQLAFQGVTTPMGVATYDNVRLKEIVDHLPSLEQIQEQVKIAEEEYKNERKRITDKARRMVAGDSQKAFLKLK